MRFYNLGVNAISGTRWSFSIWPSPPIRPVDQWARAGPGRHVIGEKGGRVPGSEWIELGLCVKTAEYKNTLSSHLAVDPVERPPTLLLTFTSAA
jgi:hypothetical protein